VTELEHPGTPQDRSAEPGPEPVAAEPFPAVRPAPDVPPVVGTRQLIGASFDLLLRSGDQMRRASFYIGLIVLGTAAPLALALWGSLLTGNPFAGLDSGSSDATSGWLVVLTLLLVAGIIVASIESTAISIALLGGAFAGRPLTIREAVQRSRMTFWAIVVANLVVSIPSTLIQQWIGQSSNVGIALGLIVGTLIQAPFVYAQAGIVLGGVGPIEALKRSVRIVRARKLAAIVLAILPSVYGLLILVAFGAGVDLAIRAVDALGLGADSGPAGLALVTLLIVMVAFALGTLLFTATAIIFAPQAVMFVGLTRATMGLDRVRPGGDHDVDRPARGRPPFRWLTRPMLLGFALGGVSLAAYLATISS
jgi:hypothetical protein